MTKDKASRIKKLEVEQKEQKRIFEDKFVEYDRRLEEYDDRLEDLDLEVNELKSWMAQPCLQTALEVTFKSKMGLQISSDSGLGMLLNNATDEDVIDNTHLSKNDWRKMYRFFNDDPSRNDIIHEKLPSSKLIKKSFEHLRKQMNKEQRTAFTEFLKLTR